MVDISNKKVTSREASAYGEVILNPDVIKLIKDKKLPKGEVLNIAKYAGIMGAKKTSELIPLCHPIGLNYIDLKLKVKKDRITIESKVKAEAKTGAEMEALSAVAVAALTVYDMCKSVNKDIEISKVQLLKKSGGKSGTYVRKK